MYDDCTETLRYRQCLNTADCKSVAMEVAELRFDVFDDVDESLHTYVLTQQTPMLIRAGKKAKKHRRVKLRERMHAFTKRHHVSKFKRIIVLHDDSSDASQESVWFHSTLTAKIVCY